MKRALLQALLAAREEKRAVVLATALDGEGRGGRQGLVFDDTTFGAEGLAPEIVAAARRALASGVSAVEETAEGRMFLHVFVPPLRLVIVGAVHIAQLLAPMAALLGYQTIVVDPRRSFASADRFPGVEITHEWPDEALERLRPDRRTAVVTLTHDPKLDDPALRVALRSDAFYIGCLGSKRTHAARLERLREAGLEPPAGERIHAPVGLPIGALSPAEIATAIVAEIINVLRRGRVA